jgi:hypothetical protein
MLVALALASPVTGFAQGLVDGFMRGEGKIDVALSYSNESYSQYFVGTTLAKHPLSGETPDPSNPNLGKITTQSIGFYAAAGIMDDLDVIVALPYITAGPNKGYWATQSGLQDLSAAVKYRPLQLVAEGLGRLDLIASAGISIPVSNYINDAPIAIGHGSNNGDFRLLAHMTSELGLFATLQAGYIRRSNVDLDKGYEVSVPDAVDTWAKIGYASSFIYGDIWINRQNAQGGTDLGPPSNTFPSNGVSYTRIGANVYYPLTMLVDGLGISAGGAYTLAGRNVGKSTRFSFGLSYGVDLF